MVKWSVLLGTVIAGSLLLTGCGKETMETTVGKEEAAWTFAMSGQYKPFNYFDVKSNELTGFDVEVGKALAKEMGMTPKPLATPWNGLISGLNAGKYQAILGSMAITEERKKEVDFSDPYYISGAQLYVKPGSAIKSISDVKKDTKVGVTISTTYEQEARKYTDSIASYDSDNKALRELADGRVDAVITDRLVGMLAAKELKIEVEAAGDLLYQEEMGIAFRQDDDELREKVNEALQKIQASGEYEKISQKYFERNISKP